jgi:hypothetical protein
MTIGGKSIDIIEAPDNAATNAGFLRMFFRRRFAMTNHKIIAAVLVLALASMACGFNINLPKRVEPGPEKTEPIDVAAPASGAAKLTISFGAGELKLAPGAQGKLAQGTATYNLDDLKPEIVENGSEIQIKQDNYDFKNLIDVGKMKNVWDLKLGDTPMDLSIEAGAYQGTLALGGLSLQTLSIKDGAAQTEVTFDAPNATEMSVLHYETGASSVTLKGLANANFSTMLFKAGAGEYDLDFSGELKRDATINLDCGLSDLTVRIPKSVHAVVTVEGGLNNVSTSSGWTKSGNTYTQDGTGPTLTFVVNMGAGNMTLTD